MQNTGTFFSFFTTLTDPVTGKTIIREFPESHRVVALSHGWIETINGSTGKAEPPAVHNPNEDQQDFAEMSLPALRNLAETLNIDGSKMSKIKLIAELNLHTKQDAATPPVLFKQKGIESDEL